MSKLALGLLVAALIGPQDEERVTPKDQATWCQMTYRDAIGLAEHQNRPLLRIDILPKFKEEKADVDEPRQQPKDTPPSDMGAHKSLEFIMTSILGREEVRDDLDGYAVIIVDKATLPGGGRLVPDATTVRYAIFDKDGDVVKCLDENDADTLGDYLNASQEVSEGKTVPAPFDGEIVWLRLPGSRP
jgi:hypothetical protein